jgi:hypothetical protein
MRIIPHIRCIRACTRTLEHIFKGMIPAIAIANKNRAPSGLTVDAIWKKSWDVSLSSPLSGDCVGSAFAAFGATAPSLYDPQGTPLQILKRSEANMLAFGLHQIIPTSCRRFQNDDGGGSQSCCKEGEGRVTVGCELGRS